MSLAKSDQRRWLIGLILAGAVALVWGATENPRNDYTFSLIGDRTGGHYPGIFERVWREVGLLAPDFALNVGDTIEGYIRDPKAIEQVANQQWDEIDRILQPYGMVPLRYTPGNHDVWDDTSAAIYQQRTGQPLQYSFVYQDSLFVVLDNSRGDVLSDEQLAWLEAELTANEARHPKFVIFHQPYWRRFPDRKLTDWPLHALCLKSGVQWVITGHLHYLIYDQADGVNYLSVGSSGGSIGKWDDGRPKIDFESGHFFHHVLARVRGGQVQMTVKEIDGFGGEGRMFDLGSWRGTAPRFDPVEDPYYGERDLQKLEVLLPRAGSTVPRGPQAILALGPAPPAEPLWVAIDGVRVSTDPSGFVAGAMQVHDLHSVQNLDQVYVNGEFAARLSPTAFVTGYNWVGFAIPRALWTKQSPPSVRVTAGTPADGTGADPEANNDDYRFKQLMFFDGTIYQRDAVNPATERVLGDGAKALDTKVDLEIDQRVYEPEHQLLVHTWETTALPAGEHVIEVGAAGRTARVKVTLE